MNPNPPEDTNQTQPPSFPAPTLTSPEATAYTPPVTPPLSQAGYSPVAPPAAKDPGKTLAIVGIILAFVSLSLVGLILSIVAKSKSKKAGFKNTAATVGIVLNSIFLALSLIFIPIILVLTLTAYSGIQDQASDSLTYSELAGLEEELQTYISDHEGKIPMTLSDLKNNVGFKESLLTDEDGKAYTLTWQPKGCTDLTECTSYTLSGDSKVKKGEKVSISYNGVTGKTTTTNTPTSHN